MTPHDLPTLAIREARRFADGDDASWRFESCAAMECHGLEYRISCGIAIFDLITRIDEDWRHRVCTGAAPYSADVQNRLRQAYELWLQPTAALLSDIERLQADHFAVKSAEEFRQRVREALGIVANDAEFFDHAALVELRDDALDAHGRGETFEYGSG